MARPPPNRRCQQCSVQFYTASGKRLCPRCLPRAGFPATAPSLAPTNTPSIAWSTTAQYADSNAPTPSTTSFVPTQAPRVHSIAPQVATSQAPSSWGQSRRKALLIGINYVGTRYPALETCVNDIHSISKLLEQRFQFQTMILPEKLATREGILARFRQIVSESQSGDSLYIHFSGHGSEFKSKNGQGRFQTIAPYDGDINGEIRDSELHHILVKGLRPGIKMTVVVDACHSGSILKLPHTVNETKAQALGLAADSSMTGEQAQHATDSLRVRSGRANSSAPGSVVLEMALEGSLVVCLSSCKTFQHSSDGPVGSLGALTGAMLLVLKNNARGSVTLKHMLREIRKLVFLAVGFNDLGLPAQTPELSSNKDWADIQNSVFLS